MNTVISISPGVIPFPAQKSKDKYRVSCNIVSALLLSSENLQNLIASVASKQTTFSSRGNGMPQKWIFRKIGVGGVNIWKTVTGEVIYQQNFVEMLSMISSSNWS
ncbi:hypothetical protein D5086_000303 [Populus alba]|uniref:Uncharacterized protein n=1 Tax=Populus alba TaxID=43335 RepID=A0ACC4CVZ8_POPAL